MRSTEPKGIADLHSHLIPGVDDGARTLEEALEGVGRLWEAGVRRLVTTPHLEGSLTQTAGEVEERLKVVDRAWDALRSAVKDAFPELQVSRGHEVMLDVPDPDLSDPRVRIAGSSYVLVEWPRLKVPPSTPEALERLRNQGWQVILAHPERYHGLDPNSGLPGEWRRMGALLQVNYGSLLGRYGDLPRRRAQGLLARGWVDLFSTDFHGRPHLPLYIDEAREAMADLGGGEHFHLLARVNPARILDGGDLVPVPPLAAREGMWTRVMGLLKGKERVK